MTVAASTTPDAIRAGRALGSPLRLTVAGTSRRPEASTSANTGARVDSVDGANAVDRAWAEIVRVFADVDDAMSRYREDSEVTRLHRARMPVAGLSRFLVAALSAADRAGRLTDGRFDARVVVDLERLGFGGVPQAWAPGRSGSAFERGAPGRFMRRTGRRGEVELLAPVDLGGIGKGLALRWAARRAAAVLGDHGFLIDAGGDIVSRGLRAGEPWSVGIEDPAGGGEPLAVVALRADQSIATSSVRIGRGTSPDGRPVHHLIDPSTGAPGGAGLAAVTVAWQDPAWAEVWSKALFLEGAAGIAAVARRRGLSAWWVDEAGELSMTPAARQQTSWVRAEAQSRGAG